MHFGAHLTLRSLAASNPLAPNHPVVLTTREAGAALTIGEYVGITGGAVVCAQRVSIGSHVMIGANSIICDTDFHPLDAAVRRERPLDAATAPVIIEDDVFIGMGCLILKGVTIGRGSVIGAGSVVTRDVPAGVIAAGSPARVIRAL
ncbi:MAG: acetyltransferase [Anaerolineae bacterium]|nr:acetyltransferase [Anaerolineae bacterium]